jgi:threonine dehydrogenase-like Zn-dependent dehydrogenase
MLGLHLERGHLALREDLPRAPFAPGETRVAVLRAGICATDLALARGYMEFTGVPGHEFVGRALDGPLAGRRVVGEINAACGRCPTCAAGGDRHCPDRTVLGIWRRPGAFAEELSLPARNLMPVPDGVSTDAATFTEPLAAALAIGEQVDLRPGERALVAGDGKLGILCAWALARSGLAVTLAGRHPERADLLPPGARLAVGLLEPGAAVDGRFDLAVEATGRADTLPRVLPLVRPRGTVVLKTTTEVPLSIDSAVAVVNELRLIGSRCGRFAPALALLAAREVPVERLVAARYPLREGARAIAHAGTRGVLKVLLDVGEG